MLYREVLLYIIVIITLIILLINIIPYVRRCQLSKGLAHSLTANVRLASDLSHS